MKTIGLIGGMSFESTAVYYRMINEAVRERRGALHSAEIVLHSVDFQGIVDLQKAGRWDLAGERLGSVAKGLENAGASCALICTNTMHLVADAVQSAITVPVINIIDETAKALKAAGKQRPLLLATRYTMEHGFYTEQMARNGLCRHRAGSRRSHDGARRDLSGALCRKDSRCLARTAADRSSRRRRQRAPTASFSAARKSALSWIPTTFPCPASISTAIHATAAVDFALGGTITSAAA